MKLYCTFIIKLFINILDKFVNKILYLIYRDQYPFLKLIYYNSEY